MRKPKPKAKRIPARRSIVSNALLQLVRLGDPKRLATDYPPPQFDGMNPDLQALFDKWFRKNGVDYERYTALPSEHLAAYLYFSDFWGTVESLYRTEERETGLRQVLAMQAKGVKEIKRKATERKELLESIIRPIISSEPPDLEYSAPAIVAKIRSDLSNQLKAETPRLATPGRQRELDAAITKALPYRGESLEKSVRKIAIRLRKELKAEKSS